MMMIQRITDILYTNAGSHLIDVEGESDAEAMDAIKATPSFQE